VTVQSFIPGQAAVHGAVVAEDPPADKTILRGKVFSHGDAAALSV
jgi:hypothetical protein